MNRVKINSLMKTTTSKRNERNDKIHNHAQVYRDDESGARKQIRSIQEYDDEDDDLERQSDEKSNQFYEGGSSEDSDGAASIHVSSGDLN